ncbi:hypothetical protein [Streptomyces violaceus]|uniref:Secreted protein n=1 Tax=Streptomyces violaceus TaxID=1936 RepID=A0ABY9ULK1_STRVL|nr:hypothetical protein [Streptomyces janthinus]WND21141.1 hypothetical protein RI060_29080 [Streptomyces janthinus]GGS47918.1 hypothetical protein GCM10010270_17460 [Streptomyces janthinus]
MRWLILGALLGLLLTFPSLLAAAVTVAAAAASEPLVVAFALGLAARPYLPQMRRWAR